MEIRDVVTLVLGSNFIIALATFITTFFITRMQLINSTARFEKAWQRKVKGDQLFKLRDQLAFIGAKMKPLVINTRGQHCRSDITNEEKNKELAQAVKDLYVNLENEDLLKTLHLQYDADLLKMMDGIISKYYFLFTYALNYESLGIDLQKEFNKLSQDIETQILEVQGLVNKKLVEL